jgi:hypothetical protein
MQSDVKNDSRQKKGKGSQKARLVRAEERQPLLSKTQVLDPRRGYVDSLCNANIIVTMPCVCDVCVFVFVRV